MCSWKAEVITNRAGPWVSNRLRFATDDEARDYVIDLAGRWNMISNSRVVPSDEPVNYRYINRQLLSVVPLWTPQPDTMGELA
jgi:hypothetical protein